MVVVSSVVFCVHPHSCGAHSVQKHRQDRVFERTIMVAQRQSSRVALCRKREWGEGGIRERERAVCLKCVCVCVPVWSSVFCLAVSSVPYHRCVDCFDSLGAFASRRNSQMSWCLFE